MIFAEVLKLPSEERIVSSTISRKATYRMRGSICKLCIWIMRQYPEYIKKQLQLQNNSRQIIEFKKCVKNFNRYFFTEEIEVISIYQKSARHHLSISEMESTSHSVMSNSLGPHGLYNPWNSPGQNTEVAILSFLQGFFATQEFNPGLLNWRQILYQLSHKGSPRMLEWVAFPFSSGSSQPRNWTGVSCIAGGFFTNWVNQVKWWYCLSGCVL